MKKYLILLLGLTILFSACEKLDQVPEDTATRDAIFGNETGLSLYTNSFYEIIPSASSIHQSDAMADYAARTQVPDFLREGAFGPRQSSGWDWSQLRNINYFIENCTDPRVSETVRRNYIGIARFFRAFFYFEKVKRFGDVPWINKTFEVNDPDLFKGRDSRTLVMDSVLADLDYAAANITAANDNSRSLISKNVAYAFKSRVCLFEGTYRKYHDELNLGSTAEKWLTEAVNAAEKVINTGGYSLYNGLGTDKSYRQLFTSTTPVTSEVLLSVVMDANLSVFNDANWWWTSATYGSRVSFIRTFVNTYLSIDGTPFTSKPGYETMTFMEEVKNRDKRLQQTIRMGDYKRVNGGSTEPAPPVFSYTYTGYQPIKWTLDDVYYDGGNRNINSICVIRLAEVLLNYAEAKAELGTFAGDDWTKTVGALRTRAGIANANTLPTVVDPYMQTNYFPAITDPVLMEIRRERGIELALEGFRFYDIVRWKRGELMEQTWNGFYVPALNQPMDLNEDGILDVCFYKEKPATQIAGVTYVNVAETISNGPNPQRLSHDTYGELTWLANVPRKWETKHYLYPIPENDRLLNPALSQNPGW
ncbi:RagB/SusD family nutrient uptake outer membrane protein [Xanthocytophaga agilis]|uniref:RagB/SusD family nutrient uptake outer membrane protein n=1 Tax=Xanthocytophaga agilis TaxID=3048010 RepID=A0AAE3RAR1_9BACT|nr:RagB/SusD family nutrient uptake outer membrane protein [Xanthocytophaga agilis]MDJ1506360.1 RagB/SusD family nutrient uptake outer membrane protein [Xanthocytophaga agilis]